MDGFTPNFFLQLLIAVGSAGAVYGAIRADLTNLTRSLDEERRLREVQGADADTSIHDLRDELGSVSLRVARQEGANDVAERLVVALKSRA